MTTFAQNTQHITGPSSQRVRVRSVGEVAEGLVLTRPPDPVSLSMSPFSNFDFKLTVALMNSQ